MQPDEDLLKMFVQIWWNNKNNAHYVISGIIKMIPYICNIYI